MRRRFCGWNSFHRNLFPDRNIRHSFWSFNPAAPYGIFLLCFVVICFIVLFGCWRHRFSWLFNLSVPSDIFGGELLCVAVALRQLPLSLRLVASDSLCFGFCRVLQSLYSIHFADQLGSKWKTPEGFLQLIWFPRRLLLCWRPHVTSKASQGCKWKETSLLHHCVTVSDDWLIGKQTFLIWTVLWKWSQRTQKELTSAEKLSIKQWKTK